MLQGTVHAPTWRQILMVESREQVIMRPSRNGMMRRTSPLQVKGECETRSNTALPWLVRTDGGLPYFQSRKGLAAPCIGWHPKAVRGK